MVCTILFYFNPLCSQIDKSKLNQNCKQPRVVSYFCIPLHVRGKLALFVL